MYLVNGGIKDVCQEALAELDIDLDELEKEESDPTWQWRTRPISNPLFHGIYGRNRNTWSWVRNSL